MVALLSKYEFNSLSRADREINDHDVPWIFLPEVEESLPLRYVLEE